MRTKAVFLILSITLASCSMDSIELSESPTIPVEETLPPTNTREKNPSPEPTPTSKPTIGVTSPATHTPDQTPLPVPQICSPLEIHPIEELTEIIGDAYDPPRPGREERHHGIDLAYYHYQDRDSMLGEMVQSVMPGVVASVLDGQYPYGNMVIIETDHNDLPDSLGDRIEIPPGQSLYILYAHLDQPPLVELRERVASCQQLGEVGMSGNTDIPHLHIESRLGPAGQVFESMRFYDTRASQEEMDAYVLWRTSGIFQHFDPLQLLDLVEMPEGTPVGE
jgi:murein DD-endopeptidase MepM/ murein hydrolase activator NlpD